MPSNILRNKVVKKRIGSKFPRTFFFYLCILDLCFIKSQNVISKTLFYFISIFKFSINCLQFYFMLKLLSIHVHLQRTNNLVFALSFFKIWSIGSLEKLLHLLGINPDGLLAFPVVYGLILSAQASSLDILIVSNHTATHLLSIRPIT